MYGRIFALALRLHCTKHDDTVSPYTPTNTNVPNNQVPFSLPFSHNFRRISKVLRTNNYSCGFYAMNCEFYFICNWIRIQITIQKKIFNYFSAVPYLLKIINLLHIRCFQQKYLGIEQWFTAHFHGGPELNWQQRPHFLP